MSILTVQKLSKTFVTGLWPFTKIQCYPVVKEVSFAMKEGEILGFLGTNGAGKTTTIQMLLGVLTPTAGFISYFGKNFAQHRLEILKKISYVSGYDKLPARLTVWENLDIVGRIYCLKSQWRAQQIERLLKSFNMWHLRYAETGSLSAGQTTRVMIVKAFLSDPQIVLLDEPTASLDPDGAHDVRQFLLEQRKERGVSLFITSHNMDEVTEVCDRVLVLKRGMIIADNTPKQLANSVSNVRLHLAISNNLEVLLHYLADNKIVHRLYEYEIEVEVDEHEIAGFLSNLAERKVHYSRISIHRPTLEDYFLSIAKN